MKTVSGKVVNTAPISLSKAAKVISNFASFDNGASDAVSIYLRRASEAFDALVQFHKDLKAPRSHSTRKPKNRHSSTDPQINEEKENSEDGVEEKKKKKHRKEAEIENPKMIEKGLAEDGMKNRDKKKRKRGNEDEERLNVEDGDDKDKKKRNSGEEGVDSAEKSRKKKSKRIKIES